MSFVPPPTEDDPDFTDDPSIRDIDLLYRGIKQDQMPHGRVSASAFMPRRLDGVYRHVSVFLQRMCTPQEVFNILRKSVALAQLPAEVPRSFSTIVGVAFAGGHRAHARIIRERAVTDEEWALTAADLALACTVAHVREA